MHFSLLDDNFEANVFSYTKLIHAIGKQNNLDKAKRNVEDMKRRGFRCYLASLTTLINIYSKCSGKRGKI